MRLLSVLLAFIAWSCSVLTLLLGLLWGLGLKCDDACSPQRGWQGDPDAWQWYGVAALGVFTSVAGTAFFVLIWRRRPLLAAIVAVAGMAAAARLMRVFSTDWIDHLDRRSPGELLLMLASVFAPILAVLLAIEPRSAVAEVVRRRE